MATNLVVIVNADKGYLARIGASNLLEVTFRPQPTGLRSTERAGNAANRWAEAELPAPWQSEDIGGAYWPGSARFASGLFRVRSAGTNILEDADSFHFAYKPVRGNSEIVARVIQVQFTDPGAKAGVMMRGDLTADAPCALLAVTAGRRGLFQWREKKGTAASLALQRDMFVPYWIKLKREGDTFTGYKSRNGSRWWLVDQAIVPMPEEIFVGMAVTSGHAERLNRSTFDHVREAPSLAGTSFVPRVELLSGSRVIGPIESADAASIRLAGSPARPPIPVARVSRILFQWVPFRWSDKVAAGRPGVLLTEGDFVEGEFRGVENARLTVSSVLFGMRSYDLHHDVIAVVLRKRQPSRQQFEVRTVDGSTWFGDDLEIGWNEVVLSEAALGRCRFPIYELGEVRRKPM